MKRDPHMHILQLAEAARAKRLEKYRKPKPAPAAKPPAKHEEMGDEMGGHGMHEMLDRYSLDEETIEQKRKRKG